MENALPRRLRLAGAPGAAGVDPNGSAAAAARGAEVRLHRELFERRIAEIKSRIRKGGLREAAIRGLIYVGMRAGRAWMSADSRRCGASRARHGMPRLTLTQFKAMVREQFFMLLIDPEAALAGNSRDAPSERRSADAGVRCSSRKSWKRAAS